MITLIKKSLKFFIIVFLGIPIVIGIGYSLLDDDSKTFNKIATSVRAPLPKAKPVEAPDCDKFDSHLVKIAPKKTGKWGIALADSQYCYEKTNKPYFKDLVSRYQEKVQQAAKRKLEEQQLIKKLGPKPLTAAAKSYIKKVARNPASVRDVECSTAMPSKNKDSWVQTCNFKGKNAFGGFVSNQITVKIRENIVIGTVK